MALPLVDEQFRSIRFYETFNIRSISGGIIYAYAARKTTASPI
jgi:hypothetical protein